MRLDRANRSYVALLFAAGAIFVALATASCALLALLAYRLTTEDAVTVDDLVWAGVGVMFLSVNVAGGAIGVNVLASQLAATRRLARRVRRSSRERSRDADLAAARSGLTGSVDVLDDPERYSFTYGVLRRRVVVSRGLLESASRAELEAVLAHERYHVRNFDPLKVVVARSLSRAFFLVPAISRLESRYIALRELAADRAAVETTSRGALAGALAKTVRGPAWLELCTTAAIGGTELLDVRVGQLEAGREPRLDRLPSATLGLSVAALGVMLAGFVATVVALGGSAALVDPRGAPAAAMVVMCGLPWLAAAWAAIGWLRA